MSTPPLQLLKTRHSVHPWRIGLLHADDRWQPIAHLTFALRRDAVLVLAALRALDVAWEADPATWTTEVWDAVHALVEASPGWAVHQRGRRAWETPP